MSNMEWRALQGKANERRPILDEHGTKIDNTTSGANAKREVKATKQTDAGI